MYTPQRPGERQFCPGVCFPPTAAITFFGICSTIASSVNDLNTRNKQSKPVVPYPGSNWEWVRFGCSQQIQPAAQPHGWKTKRNPGKKCFDPVCHFSRKVAVVFGGVLLPGTLSKGRSRTGKRGLIKFMKRKWQTNSSRLAVKSGLLIQHYWFWRYILISACSSSTAWWGCAFNEMRSGLHITWHLILVVFGGMRRC